MELQTIGEKALANKSTKIVFKVPTIPKKKVLDEDTHTEVSTCVVVIVHRSQLE